MSTISVLSKLTASALFVAMIGGFVAAPALANPSPLQTGPSKAVSASRLFGSRSSVNVLRVKLRDGADSSQFDAYAKRLGAKVQNVFSSTDQSLQGERLHAQSRSGRALTSLGQYKRLILPKGKSVATIIDSVDSLSDVQFSYSEALPAPAPSASYVSQQLYRSPAPVGLNAGFLAKVPGAQGAAKIVDVEYSWDLTHEDLSKARASGALIPNGSAPFDPFSYPNHGTAVLGELVADANSFGVTGITPNSPVGMVNTYDGNNGLDIANAVNVAHQHMAAGDVMLIEQQVNGPIDGDYVPVEWDPATYDAIVSAVSDGVTVVEAAGNGGEDLDNPIYGTSFPSSKPDSGAIIVGAGGSGGQTLGCNQPFSAALSRLPFSDYGSRVNLQGWGECVVTAEGNKALTPNAPLNQSYTNDFDGTSSAAPMVASAAAALSSSSKQLFGTPLYPQQILELLVQTGTPQVFTADTSGQNIGPMPNLQAALESLTRPNIFADSFSSSSLSAWTAGSGVTVQSAKAASAPYAAEAKSTGKAADEQKSIAAQADLYLSANVYIASQSSSQVILLSMLNAKGSRVAYLYRTGSGYLAVHDVVTGKNVVSSTKLAASAWHTVQLHLRVGSSPLVEVWLDGTALSSLHLAQSTGTSSVTKIQIGDQNTGRTFNVYFDDVGVSTRYIAP